VKFLGAIDNEKCCEEVVQADLYMQLSGDHLTKVPGGSYIHCEGMGRSILEAITAGIFVIAGKSGALPEIVDEERGVLLDLTSAKQVADKVEPFLQTTPPRREFTDVYSWNHVFKQYEQIMRDWDGTAHRHRKV
jgi:glycosyltransferase involved in cell wall biosynthesis